MFTKKYFTFVLFILMMKNSELIEKLLEFPENESVLVSNFEDEMSDINIANVCRNPKKQQIVIQLHGDAQYINTARYSLLESEHKILCKLISALMPIIEKNPVIFKNSNIKNLLANIDNEIVKI